jgi:hypothetical protein
MKCQIQVRGDWNGLAGDWRPIAVPARNGMETTTFASWDEAEEGLDQMQQAGLLPTDAERYGVELRIIDIDDRRRAKRAETMSDLRAPGA